MKNIVVTGCARGLGLSIANLLIKKGFFVIGIGRSLSNEYNELKEKNPDSCSFELYDFVNLEGIQGCVKNITKKYGPIFGLINNAALGYDGVLATMHESQISQIIKVNIEAPIILTKYVSRSMLIKQEGRIVNIGSIIGSTGFNGLSVYGATKAAMSGFTKSLSRELGRANVTVNTIAPGYMKTNMTSGLEGKKLESIVRRSPLGELASVDDAAAMVVYLLSDDAKMLTGATFTVDAGSTA